MGEFCDFSFHIYVEYFCCDMDMPLEMIPMDHGH